MIKEGYMDERVHVLSRQVKGPMGCHRTGGEERKGRMEDGRRGKVKEGGQRREKGETEGNKWWEGRKVMRERGVEGGRSGGLQEHRQAGTKCSAIAGTPPTVAPGHRKMKHSAGLWIGWWVYTHLSLRGDNKKRRGHLSLVPKPAEYEPHLYLL